jgi:general secretion pathway protein I
MKFRPTSSNPSGAKRRAGFTLVEVLAALVFMAIVIPTAVHGLRVANLAGLIGLRKAAAARIAERELNELLVTGNWRSGAQNGTVQEGALQYRWTMRTEPWNQLVQKMTVTGSGGIGPNALKLLTVQVSFPLQGQSYDVRLSTLIDPNLQ